MFRWTLILLCMLATDLVQAESLRCGTRLVSPGDSKAIVLLRCGEPLTKATSKILKNNKSRKFVSRPSTVDVRPEVIRLQTEETIIVTRWTYNPGKGKFLRLLTFHGDELESIVLGDRVE